MVFPELTDHSLYPGVPLCRQVFVQLLVGLKAVRVQIDEGCERDDYIYRVALNLDDLVGGERRLVWPGFWVVRLSDPNRAIISDDILPKKSHHGLEEGPH